MMTIYGKKITNFLSHSYQNAPKLKQSKHFNGLINALLIHPFLSKGRVGDKLSRAPRCLGGMPAEYRKSETQFIKCIINNN